MRLASQITSDVKLGACYYGKPLLGFLTAETCSFSTCLCTGPGHVCYDLFDQPFRKISPNELCVPAEGGQLPLPADKKPEVSLILTVHNHMASAAQVMLELFRTSHEADSVEFVVVNDGSTQSDHILVAVIQSLQDLFGARVTYIVHPQALGFGPSNDAGIAKATGEMIVLVNSDMFPAMGWLAVLLETMRSDTSIGIAGPMFIGDDSVQEAGGIVWNDGTGANYGRYRSVGEFDGIDYARAVDYVSGACLMMAKDTYKLLGGFDKRFEQGYYEDTDLAMAARQRGLKTVYQPLSVVYHQEGTTLGTDASVRKQELMAINRASFVLKWQAELNAHLPSSSNFDDGARRLNGPSILLVDSILPEPDRDSGSIRATNLVRILLRRGFSLSYQATNDNETPFYAPALRFLGVQILPVRPVVEWKLSANGTCMYDLFIISRRDVMVQALLKIQLFCPGIPVVYDTVDLHFLREARVHLSEASREQAWNFKRTSLPAVEQWIASSPAAANIRIARDAEIRLMNSVNATWIVSDKEQAALTGVDKPVYVVSNMHDVPPLNGTTPCSQRAGALFIGNLYHVPNQLAITTLVDVIVPQILQVLPPAAADSFVMHIAGANSLPADQEARLLSPAMARQRIRFHGFVDDAALRDLYSSVRVVLAPLTSGAGVKGKVNQAMMLGVPVVTTPVAAEGMHIRDGVDGMVATSLEEFIQKTVQVYTGCASLWPDLAFNGHAAVKHHFSVDSVEPVVLESLEALDMNLPQVAETQS